MKRVILGVCFACLIATASIRSGSAAGPFDQKLPPDKQAAHVLHRLTFGPRPGDLAEVRRIGVEAWIRRQLDPAAMAEPPALTARLATLESLALPTWQIFETYQPPQPQVRMMVPNLSQLLTPDQNRRLQTGTPLERQAVIDALPAEARQQVLATVPPNVFDALPALKQEAERARQIQEEVRNRAIQEQQRRLRPPLNELLTPEQARDLQRGTTEEKLSVLAALDRETRTRVLRQVPPNIVPDAFKREALAATNPRQAVVAELVEAKLQRAVYSPRQLEEVLVDFWFNHFNVFSGKANVGMLLTSYERDAIRPFVLGRFRDMLLATARHPAMLVYLDNHVSRAPQDSAPGVVFVGGGGPRPGLNENYGRELMELHTLGAGGGYTQEDVIDVARAFTGWTVFDQGRYGEFDFNPSMHDRGEKVVLGRTFARGGGEDEGLAIIELLAAHPSTARFISTKLARRFVADHPPATLVDRMAATFTSSGGDLRAVMDTLLFSREFMSAGAWQAKTKTPFEFVVSALRAVSADVTDTTALAQRLTEMGQPLYGRTDPNGYPDAADAWSASVGLLARMNFANALLVERIGGVTVDTTAFPGSVRGALAALTGIEPPEQTVSLLERDLGGELPAPPALAAIIVGSPDFQKR